MSNYEYEGATGKPHHVLGLVLGILGIIIALALALWTGVIGGGIALVLGVIGLILGVKARKHHKGIGAIITGALAILLAIFMTVTAIGTVGALREQAVKTDRTPLLAKYTDSPYLGLLGVALKAANDGAGSVEQLNKEMEFLNSLEKR